MKNIIYSLLLILFCGIGLANAQKGKVTGTVIDGEFVEPMAFANILVKGTTTGTTSDFDGLYEISDLFYFNFHSQCR